MKNIIGESQVLEKIIREISGKLKVYWQFLGSV